MIEKCNHCLKSRPIISENGFHYGCGLSNKKALECMIGKKDHSVILVRSGEQLTEKEVKAILDEPGWEEIQIGGVNDENA